MAGKITAAGTINGRKATRFDEIREQRVEKEKIETVLILRAQGAAIQDQQAYEALYLESLENVSPGDGGGAAGDGGASGGASGDGSGGDGGSGTGDGGSGDGGSGDGGTGDGGPGGPGGDGGNY